MNAQEAIEKVDGMVITMAMKYMAFVHHGKLGLDDLIQAGRMGVLQAHSRFDPAINPHFPTYAGYWIRAYVRRECMERGRTVRIGVKLQREATRAGTSIPIALSNVDDLARHLKASEPEPDHTEVYKKALDAAMRNITVRERKAIRMRYFEDKTLSEIGANFGVSRERARQIIERAMDKLSGHVPEYMKEYL